MKFSEFCNFMVAMATGQFIMIKKCRILTKYVIIDEHTHFQKNLRQGHICHLVNLALCVNFALIPVRVSWAYSRLMAIPSAGNAPTH